VDRLEIGRGRLLYVIDVWDFHAGSNFVLEMQNAATIADRTIAVLSQKYLESSFTAPEWAAAFAQDPQGRKQKLIPIRIAPCDLTGILAPIVYLDLVGLPEEDASAALLGAFSARNKPSSTPAFPGPPTAKAFSVTQSQPSYPGTKQTAARPVTESLASLIENTAQNRGASRLSALERLEFMRRLNAILPQQFNMLVAALNPEPGLVPPRPAPQADRTTALVAWADGPTGCGLSLIQEVLKAILDPQVGPSQSNTPTVATPATPVDHASEPPLSGHSTLVGQAVLPKNGTPNVTEVVLLIHGIRDFAEWQDMVSTVLAEIPTTEISPLKYGRFDAFRFWFPFLTRQAPVTKLLWRIRAARDRLPTPQLSVIAHSFGTYAIGKILKENPDIRLHRLILCGAILPSGLSVGSDSTQRRDGYHQRLWDQRYLAGACPIDYLWLWPVR
jgi:hypothetical protein